LVNASRMGLIDLLTHMREYQRSNPPKELTMSDQITVRQLLDAMDALNAKYNTLSPEVRAQIYKGNFLLEAFDGCTEPLDRDIVITREVAQYLQRHTDAKPSADSVGKRLCSLPYMGEPKQWRCGETRYRGVIIRNHARWRNASGPDIMAHIAGDSDELLS